MVSNTVRENTSDGILVQSGPGVVVQTNQFENNGGNGILDDGAGTTMTGNVTNANGGDGVLQSRGPAVTFAQSSESVAQACLSLGPVERHALTGIFLQRLMKRGNRLLQSLRSCLALAKHSERIA